MRRFRVAAFAALFFTAVFLPLAAQDPAGAEPAAKGAIPGFTSYKPIYFIFGWGNQTQLDSNDLVLVNFSFKYDASSQYKLGFYMGYTQTMYWSLFDNSGPFREINFRPEVFWRFESGNNFADDAVIPAIDYLQLGWEHRSNGKDGAISRGWDRGYAQVQLGFGEKVHFAANAKCFYYIDIPERESGLFSLDDNPDITDYTSNFEFQLIGNFDIPVVPFKVVLSGGPGGGPFGFDFTRGWQQLDAYFFKFAGNLRPYLQIWNGYGQSIESYNESSFNAHAGIAIEM